MNIAIAAPFFLDRIYNSGALKCLAKINLSKANWFPNVAYTEGVNNPDWRCFSTTGGRWQTFKEIIKKYVF